MYVCDVTKIKILSSRCHKRLLRALIHFLSTQHTSGYTSNARSTLPFASTQPSPSNVRRSAIAMGQELAQIEFTNSILQHGAVMQMQSMQNTDVTFRCRVV